jgi:ribose transport system ATP-binding protein
LFVSSYLPELMGTCDRIAVMRRGELLAIRPTTEWTEHAILEVASRGADALEADQENP